MDACLVMLGLVLGCTSTAPEPDRWIGEDKLQHFTLSFAATALGYGGARVALDPRPAWTTAGGVAIAAGLAKEISDVRAGRRFSWRDLAWDAAGVALGLSLADQIR